MKLQAVTNKKFQYLEGCQKINCFYSSQAIDLGTFACTPPVILRTSLIVLLSDLEVLRETRTW